MPLSVRLDNETETLLIKTDRALNTTKSELRISKYTNLLA
jgi:hypothetical protein